MFSSKIGHSFHPRAGPFYSLKNITGFRLRRLRPIARNKPAHNKWAVLDAVELSIGRCSPGAACDISLLIAIDAKIALSDAALEAIVP